MIWVVNFPFCNFHSLDRYFRISSLEYKILDSSCVPVPNDFIILPGVGTFQQGMSYLEESKLVSLVLSHANNGGFVFGICLGMQLLLNSSDENPGTEGLGLISGTCNFIPPLPSFLVPHIGWNSLHVNTLHADSFSSIPNIDGISLSDYYFVHSFYVRPDNPSVVTSTFKHPDCYLAASICQDRISGYQFHPEKSGPAGYSLLNKLFCL